MQPVRVVTDVGECRQLWQTLIPQEQVFDLWEVRYCFHEQYRHAPIFLVCEDHTGISGFLPLSRNGETGTYQYFPGETWQGKTWLEQNRIIARDRETARALLAAIPGPFHLRYLQPTLPVQDAAAPCDEIGYIFIPAHYDYTMERYFEQFSHKTGKRLRRELAGWERDDVAFRHDHLDDFETLVAMNLDRFGEASYFHDGRFLASFRSLLSLLKARDYLRLTTVLVDGRPAAVDLGCVLGQNYTLLAGGTLATVPGVAKLINIHHMQWACERRLACVDFLCGDFSWKTLFHLTPRPLFVLAGMQWEAKSHPAPAPGRHELWSSSLGESREASNA